MSADAPLLYDWSGAPAAAANAPITGRPGQALNSTAQGGMVSLAVDASGVARVPRVDSNGLASVVPQTPSGAPLNVYSGQASPATTAQYGSLIFGRQDVPTPSSYAAATMDPTGALNVHPKSKMTWRLVQAGITLGTNVVLAAIYNGSSMVLRVNDCAIMIPPAGGTGAALLGQSSGLSYYPVYCEIRRVPSYGGGAAANMVAMDTNDSLPTGITAAIKPTSIGAAAATLHRQDAYLTNVTGLPFYARGDATGKTIVVRPGDGICIICLSNGTVNSTSAGGGTVTASADLLMTMTTSLG